MRAQLGRIGGVLRYLRYFNQTNYRKILRMLRHPTKLSAYKFLSNERKMTEIGSGWATNTRMDAGFYRSLCW